MGPTKRPPPKCTLAPSTLPPPPPPLPRTTTPPRPQRKRKNAAECARNDWDSPASNVVAGTSTVASTDTPTSMTVRSTTRKRVAPSWVRQIRCAPARKLKSCNVYASFVLLSGHLFIKNLIWVLRHHLYYLWVFLLLRPRTGITRFVPVRFVLHLIHPVYIWKKEKKNAQQKKKNKENQDLTALGASTRCDNNNNFCQQFFFVNNLTTRCPRLKFTWTWIFLNVHLVLVGYWQIERTAKQKPRWKIFNEFSKIWAKIAGAKIPSNFVKSVANSLHKGIYLLLFLIYLILWK